MKKYCQLCILRIFLGIIENLEVEVVYTYINKYYIENGECIQPAKICVQMENVYSHRKYVYKWRMYIAIQNIFVATYMENLYTYFRCLYTFSMCTHMEDGYIAIENMCTHILDECIFSICTHITHILAMAIYILHLYTYFR